MFPVRRYKNSGPLQIGTPYHQSRDLTLHLLDQTQERGGDEYPTHWELSQSVVYPINGRGRKTGTE